MLTALLVVLGFFAGLLGALTGIGGGVLLTPILALHFGIPIRQAIGTSLVAVITTSAASSSVHLQRHTTDIRLGMTLELATALGAAVMAYLVGYFNRDALEGLFAGFLLYSAITILTKGRKGEPVGDESPRWQRTRRSFRLTSPSAIRWDWRRRWWRARFRDCWGLAVGRSKFRSCTSS